MMEFYVSGQSLKMFTPVTAADSLKYLTAQFHFTDNDWDGYTRWAHFRKGETVYDIELDGEDCITEEDALNLTAGEWEIYLTGTKDAARLTTIVVILTVKESGLIDAPLHVLPQSVAEQIDAKAAQALLTAQAVKAAADAGKFNGRDGKSFEIKGYYASVTALEVGVPKPAPGDAYCVGSTAPYDVYIYDGVSGEWINNGTIQGAKGDTGAAGTTFTPHLDGNGNLSWTNDGGLDNPETQNIRGAKGDKGETGAAGKSAYAAAVEAGYTGTEATFYAALTAMPYHNARHLPDGADPITVKAGNIEASAVETAKIKDGAVTGVKLADECKNIIRENVALATSAFTADSTIEGANYKAELAVTGSTAAMLPLIAWTAAQSEELEVKRIESAAGKVIIYSAYAPSADLTIPTVALISPIGTGSSGASGGSGGGITGTNGVTFTPHLSADGTLSWTNDGGLTNPVPVNIKGAKGDTGAQGEKGDKGDTGAAGSDASVTENNIVAALGYTPLKISDIAAETTETLPNYTNQIDAVGYQSDVTLDMTGAAVSGTSFVSGFIPVKKGDVIRVKDPSASTFSTGLVFALYKADKATGNNIGRYINTMQSNAAYGAVSISGNVLTWDTSNVGYYFWSGFAYLRVTTNSANSIVTINEEISETSQVVKTLKSEFKVGKNNLNFNPSSSLLSGRKVVVFGDSIIGMTRDQTSVPAYAAAYTGAKIYNAGFGGCRMSVHPSSGYAAFSMWALAEAVATGTWTTQDAQASSGQDYFTEQLSTLKGIDFSSVDAVVIHYGTNDFAANVTIDDATDVAKTTTVCGALRYSIRKLLTAYPKLKIYISLPLYRMWDGVGAETHTNSLGKKLSEYNAAIKAVAAEFNLPVIDGYGRLGINALNDSAYSTDGTHLSDHGRRAFGELIGGNLLW